MSSAWTRVLLVFAIAMVAGAVACTLSAEPEPATEPGKSTPPAPGAVAPPDPALERIEGSKGRAVGTLAYRDLEGGFFAVVDAPPGSTTFADAPVLAVVVRDGETHGDDLAALVGAYVEVSGTLSDKPTVRMSGPELNAESFRILQEPAAPAPK